MDQDFGGFRVVALLPRFKPGWVPPAGFEDEVPKRFEGLGAPRPPLPVLMPNGKPICAATIRAGPGYLEVPFFATQETRRRKGYGRGLLQARSALPLLSGFFMRGKELKATMFKDVCCFGRGTLPRLLACTAAAVLGKHLLSGETRCMHACL
jgi:hypothetical protein